MTEAAWVVEEGWMRCSALAAEGVAHGIFFPRGQGHTDLEEVIRVARRAIGAGDVCVVEQVHGTRVVAREEAVAASPCQADGVIVSGPGEWAAIRTADCVPVILAVDSTAAVVHAGWRGSAGRITERALEQLLARAKARPDDITCAIGPHIGVCCYEVSDEVADHFRSAWGESVWRPGGRGRPHLDLAAVQVAQLSALSPDRIHVSPECTRCGQLSLPSYRRDGESAGRIHTVVGFSSCLVSEGEGA